MSLKIEVILSQVDIGAYALPVFQRGYVWNRDQVRKLMYSLYHRYPIGELLVWNTATDPSITRGNGSLTAGNVNMILDGQQRITSLYGIFRGHAPAFFEGNASAFTGLYFNVETEIFEFYSPRKMDGNRAWINVTDFLKEGFGSFLSKSMAVPEEQQYWTAYIPRLTALDGIRNIDMNIETVTAEKTIDEVVEIFNNVNSGGTKLSKGELALAKICSEWNVGRDELRKILEKYKRAGYDFKMDWLLRCLTVHLTGQPYFAQLGKEPIENIKKGVYETDKLIGTCLDQISSRLGFNNTRVMGNVYPIATMLGYLKAKGRQPMSETEWNRLMFWYIHSFLWGRYASATESSLSQDLNIINAGEGIDGLIKLLRQLRGDLKIRPEDFWGWSTGARFYPMLYMLTRVYHSRDWGTGIELNNYLLGKNSSLEVHHIFPKKRLYEAGKSRAIVNALANYAFLTKGTNDKISDRYTSDYMPEFVDGNKSAVESHWIPMNPELWEIGHYEEFLEKRRELLAIATNNLLDSLNAGHLIEGGTLLQSAPSAPVDEGDDEIKEITAWLEEKQLPIGAQNLELTDPDTAETYIIDMAWPNGIQEGLSVPLALILNSDADTQAYISRLGYQFFVHVEDLKKYIERLME